MCILIHHIQIHFWDQPVLVRVNRIAQCNNEDLDAFRTHT